MSDKDKIYFSGLNGLRGVAALLVLFGHTSDLVFPNGIDYNPIWAFLSNNGGNAVSFFFVLSGFLISYLMLNEINKTNNVNIGRFYLKRVFRIWPIYYLVIIMVQFVIPFIMLKTGHQWKTISNISTFYYLLILPNIPYLFFDTGKLFHLWSIGIEEQFYLIWAPLVKMFKKHFLKLCIFVILIKLLAIYCLSFFIDNQTINSIYKILKQFRIEQMCVGGIGAYFIFTNKGKLLESVIFSLVGQIVFYLVLIFFLAFDIKSTDVSLSGKVYNILFHSLGYITIPFLFLYLLINISLNPKSYFKLENKAFDFLGKISYGFYVYHFVCVLLAASVMKITKIEMGTMIYAVLFYIVAISVNIIISWISFNYFERKILKYTRKFVES